MKSGCADAKILYVDMMERDGWTIKIKKNMYRKGLYPDDVEELFRSLEGEFIRITDQMLDGADETIISRREFDILKKYILLQRLRVPPALDAIDDMDRRSTEHYRPLFIEDMRPGESGRDWWIRAMRTVLTNDWDSLPQCDHHTIWMEAGAFNRMHPLLIETESDLVLPDCGIGSVI